MKKLVLILIITTIFATSAKSQRSEVGLMVGGSFYLGELNEQLFNNTKLAGGLMYRYNLTTHWSLRGNLFFGQLYGDDKDAGNPRNLNFKSSLVDLSAQLELNFLEFFTGSRTHYRFSPYIFGGVGVFFFDPQGYHEGRGEWLNLRALSTEGQGTSASDVASIYSKSQLCFPFGLGFKYSISKKISVGIEWSLRKTLTDYIDDVSTVYVDRNLLLSDKGADAVYMSDKTGEAQTPGTQRGNSKTTDWYSFVGATVIYKIDLSQNKACSAYQ